MRFYLALVINKELCRAEMFSETLTFDKKLDHNEQQTSCTRLHLAQGSISTSLTQGGWYRFFLCKQLNFFGQAFGCLS